jgi:hypothetical protein
VGRENYLINNPEILFHPVRVIWVFFFFFARTGILQVKLLGSIRPADKNLE